MRNILLVCLCLLPFYASAEYDNKITFGVGDVDYTNHYDDSTKATFSLGIESDHKHPWIAKYSYVPSYGPVESHHSIGLSRLGKHYINDEWFVYGSAGILANSKQTVQSSSHFNADLGLGVGYNNFRFGVRHISNAYLGDVNRGEDFLMLSYTF